MSAWLILLLGVWGDPTPKYPGAQEVDRFDFGARDTGDFGHPMGWTRLRNSTHPFYIRAELTSDESAVAGRSLRFTLNGGNCAYFCPSLKASENYNYVVRGQIKTDGLESDQALLLAEFFDEAGTVIGEPITSVRVGGTTDWKLVQIGPIAAPPGARFLRVACISRTGEPPDLSGKVYFDDLWIARLPRFDISTSAPFRLFDISDEKRASILVRGGEGRRLEARFVLLDSDRVQLHEQTVPLEKRPTGMLGETTLPIKEVGFYRLDVALAEDSNEILRREFPITVMRSPAPRVRGEFGISLPPPVHGIEQMDRLTHYSAARWLKVPLWPADSASRELIRSRSFAELLELLGRRGHAIVGRLDAPPDEILDLLPKGGDRMGDVFSLPTSAWGPSLEELLVRFNLKVSHWQLGPDDDSSFQEIPQVERYLDVVRAEASRIGREVQLGIPWNWLVAPPRTPSISFIAPGGDPISATDPLMTPLSADVLEGQIHAIKDYLGPSAGQPMIWSSITPLSDLKYDRKTRIVDFARRVTAAKVSGTHLIFASDNGRPHIGLFSADGSPTELYTIFRTLSEHLSNKGYVGQFPPLGTTTHHLFAGNGEVTVVLWSDQPESVDMVVGRQAQVIDLWGRLIRSDADGETRRINVDSTPILIVNGDELLVRLQLGVKFERGSVPSRFGTHHDRLMIANPTGSAISGTITPIFPREWNQRPEQLLLQGLPRETIPLPFSITLPQGVSQGEYLIPIDFKIQGERSYRFRLHRPFQVGGDELRVDAQARPTPAGFLEIEAAVTNLTNQAMNLTATARVKERIAELTFISNLAAGGTTTARFQFPDGAALKGEKVQIKFEDQGARREFSFEVPVK